jgi:hypothetical protein
MTFNFGLCDFWDTRIFYISYEIPVVVVILFEQIGERLKKNITSK